MIPRRTQDSKCKEVQPAKSSLIIMIDDGMTTMNYKTLVDSFTELEDPPVVSMDFL